MTDQQTPDLTALTAAVDNFEKNLVNAAGAMLTHIKTALTPDATALTEDEAVAAYRDAVTSPRQRSQSATLRLTARYAIGACLLGDDDRAARLLDGLDADQLYAIEAVASGLAIHASRHRKPLVEAERAAAVAQAAAEQPSPVGIDDLTVTPPTADKADTVVGLYGRLRDTLAAEPDLEAAPMAAALWEHIAPALIEYRDEAREQRHRAERAEADRDAQQRLAIDAGLERDNHADQLQKAEQAYGELRERYDAAEAARARWQTRGEQAEAERDALRHRLAVREAALAGARTRAEEAERRLAEMRERAERGEAEARDWRAVASRAQAARASALEILNSAPINDMIADIDDEIRAALGVDEAPTFRLLVDSHPAVLRRFLIHEARVNPNWWRGILRRELRHGELAQELRAAGLA